MGVDLDNIIVESPLTVAEDQLKENRQKNALGLLVASGLVTIATGIITSSLTKKRAKRYLASHGHEMPEIAESGTALALRALCYSTIITLGIFSISIFGVCKWFDIKNMDDLRTKLRKARKTKPPDPNERTEFENLSDFLNYLNERYGKPKDKSP